jgi:zinc protease
MRGTKPLFALASCAGLVAACGGATTVAPPPEGAPQGTQVEVIKGPAPGKEKPPASGPAREIRFPPIQRVTLDSGLELDTVELHSLPLVQLELVIGSGTASDPERLPGLAQLTAAMLKEGTRRKSSAKLAEAIEFLGAHIDVDQDEENIYINLRAMSEHFDEALKLLAEVAMVPSFDDKELAKLKKRELARLALERQNPRTLARREMYRVLYGDHPYAHVDTTEDTLKRLKRSDLQTFHRTHFAPNNAKLVVVGDVTADKVQSASERAFKGWPKRKVAEPTYTELPAREKREVFLIDRPQSVQSVIYIGNLALERKSDDYVPLSVINQVLGGSAASRLFMDLREKRSLTYGAYSDIGEKVMVAPWVAYAAVRNEVTAEALDAFMEHFDRIVQQPPPADELSDAKRFLVDRFPLRIDTPGKIASLVSELRVYDLPDDYWEGFRAKIADVSAAGALAAAQRYIHPAKLAMVVVGKAADVRPALEKWGPVTVLDVDGKVIVKPEPAAAPAEPASAPKAAEPKPQATPAAAAKEP